MTSQDMGRVRTSERCPLAGEHRGITSWEKERIRANWRAQTDGQVRTYKESKRGKDTFSESADGGASGMYMDGRENNDTGRHASCGEAEGPTTLIGLKLSIGETEAPWQEISPLARSDLFFFGLTCWAPALSGD